MLVKSVKLINLKYRIIKLLTVHLDTFYQFGVVYYDYNLLSWTRKVYLSAKVIDFLKYVLMLLFITAISVLFYIPPAENQMQQNYNLKKTFIKSSAEIYLRNARWTDRLNASGWCNEKPGRIAKKTWFPLRTKTDYLILSLICAGYIADVHRPFFILTMGTIFFFARSIKMRQIFWFFECLQTFHLQCCQENVFTFNVRHTDEAIM